MSVDPKANLSKNDQEYGSDPLAVRATDHYQAEYVQGFVEKWDALIDWDARASSEGNFFIQLLRDRGAKKVLDVATGTGYHSVQLLKAGFEVTSADGSASMLAKAFDNALNQGFVLRTILADWRWLTRDVHDKYDAVICLGNSFTHLFADRDRRRALVEFYSVLRHDGVLILDQRNYDALLDGTYKGSKTYYYCGEDVKVSPEHVDPGLARFCYAFADGGEFHLNMFPLRKEYLRSLVMEVGFQALETYGDFHETYRGEEPDFFVHVAEKTYRFEDDLQPGSKAAEIAEAAEQYYDSGDADNFYYRVWGGEDIHIGLYKQDDEEIREASRRTVERMAAKVEGFLNSRSRVLDLGAGYGGAARYLAKRFGCHVTCLNLSHTQNRRNVEMNKKSNLTNKVDVVHGNFENAPFPTDHFDLIWSQDAFLHSGNRLRVLAEVKRLLTPGGQLVFTDPMQADDCPEGVLQPVYDRIHLDSLGSFAFYRAELSALGFREMETERLTPQLITHYIRVRDELKARYDELSEHVSTEYLDKMIEGLGHWVNAGKEGYLAWGILHFRRAE